jgi:hypothetical protein
MALDDLTAVISTVPDMTLNQELCHIIFDRLKLAVIITSFGRL